MNALMHSISYSIDIKVNQEVTNLKEKVLFSSKNSGINGIYTIKRCKDRYGKKSNSG